MPNLEYTFRGLVVPVLTPFHNDSTRSLNLAVVAQYADFLAKKGVTGILVNGTCGEGMSMSVAERKALAEAWVDAVKSTKQHLVVQIGGAPLPDVRELAKHAESIGVDALLCLPELYYKPTTPEQLVQYLRLVGQAAPKTPLLYYNIPVMSNVNINMPQFLNSIGDRIPTFVGVKYTSSNLEEGTQALHADNDRFVIFIGGNEIMAGAFALGMDSTMSSSANMFPELVLDILESAKKGDSFKAGESQRKVSQAVIAMAKYGHRVETMRVAMNLLTPIDLGPPRPPMTPLSAEKAFAMKKDLEDLGYSLRS